MLPLFQDNIILVEATSSHFFRVTTLTQQFLSRSSYFFRKAAFFFLFQNSHFFAGVIFSEYLFFLEQKFYRAATSWEQEDLYGTYFSERQFFLQELFRIKISKKELLSQSRYFCTASTFQKSYILEKADFSEKQYSALPTFSGELLF